MKKRADHAARFVRSLRFAFALRFFAPPRGKRRARSLV
jgi:hypothetical protein